MTTRNSRFKNSDSSVFGRAIDGVIEEGSKLLNAIDFIDSPQGFNFKLFPMQRLIVKCIFAVPIDYKPITIPLWDVFRENKLREVSEEECLKILYEEGRCNVRDWRDIPVRGFNEASIFAGRRGGKMLSVDEVVPTPSGFVRNGDLKDGDEVFGDDGKIYKVTHAHPIVEEDAFKVSFDDGTYTYAHAGHLWHTYTHAERKNKRRRIATTNTPVHGDGLCACGCGTSLPIYFETTNGIPKGGSPQFSQEHHARGQQTRNGLISGHARTTEDIRLTLKAKTSKRESNHAIPLTHALDLPEADLPLDPYCLGAWLGDGSSQGGSSFTGKEEDALIILSYFSLAGFEWKKAKEKYAWSIYGLTSILSKMGLLNNKHIPHNYLWSSLNQRLSLLQGLMDTDGCADKDGAVEFSNTCRNLAEGVYHLAASLGLKPNFSESRARLYGKDCGPKYRVKWTSSLPVFRLERKIKRLKKSDKIRPWTKWRYITSVEPMGRMQMRCITTSNPTHLYLFGKNFNVTHNSEVVAAIGGYKLYQLLNVRSPQSYFSLKPGSPIDFTFMAQDEEGSGRLFNKLREGINTAPFFNPYLKVSSGSSLGFVSEADRNKRDVTPTINVASFACIDENELVWTEGGLTPLKEVYEGTCLLDSYGNFQHTSQQLFKEDEVLALETATMRRDPLFLSPDHTCLFVSYEQAKEALPYLGQRMWKGKVLDSYSSSKKDDREYAITIKEDKASTLKAGDYLIFPRISELVRVSQPLDNTSARKSDYSSPVTHLPVNEALCRLYGLYLAEGSVSGSRDNMSTVRWTFHINERDSYAAFIQETLLREFNLESGVFQYPETNKCEVICCSCELGRGLSHWFGRGCSNKNIPTISLQWKVEHQKSLIQGFLEGDGSDNRNIAQITSKKLAYGLYALGIQAGFNPSTMHKPSYVDKKNQVHSDSWIIEFCKQQRHNKFFQSVQGVEYYWSKITTIQPSTEKRVVVDICVSNTHTFLTRMAAFHNCTTNASRGPSNIFLALDEFAFFRGAKGSSSEEVYSSATPSTVNFKHAERVNGEWIPQDIAEKTLTLHEEYEMYQDSLVLSISSPWVKVGKMYDLHRLALDKGIESGIFTLRVSTAEMNPTILPQTLRKEYVKNPLTFKAEFGGNFLESSESYLTEAQINGCTDVVFVPTPSGVEVPDESTARLNMGRFHPDAIGRQYFWAIDLGMTNDATAVAIGHLEYKGGPQPIHLVYDYIDRMMVGEKFSGLGIQNLPGLDGKYLNYKALPLEDIIAWFKALNELMPCYRGATDQHGGQQLVQLLDLNKIHNIELVNLTTSLNSQMAYVLQGYVRDQRCHFPYVPKFLKELRLVEAEYINKYQIRVAAPLEKGSHDDMVDAAQLCAYMAQKWLMDEGGLRLDPTGQSLMMSQRMNQPSGVIGDLDRVSMRELQILERMKKIQSNMDSMSGACVRNPFHKRGR